MGNDGSGHDLVLGNRLAQMCFGVQGAVGMAFGGYMRHGPLQVLICNFIFGGIGTGKLGEGAGSRHVRKPLPGQAARIGSGKTGQAAVTGVFELFHTQGQGDIVGPGGHRVTGPAKRLGPGGTIIFNTGYRNIGKPKGH